MIAAYCHPQSALPGESVALRFTTTAAGARIRIFRQGLAEELVYEATLPGAEHPLSEDAARSGCDWPDAATITVGDDWRTGFYLVRLSTADGEQAEAFFVVRAREPGRALLVLST